jgi:hypothetical protein
MLENIFHQVYETAQGKRMKIGAHEPASKGRSDISAEKLVPHI